MKIGRLSDLDLGTDAEAHRDMRVCIVSSDFVGPIKNTGIGTVTSALARQLAVDGYDVTLLYTSVGYGKPVSGDKPWAYWVDHVGADGVKLKFIPHEGDYRAWREASWEVRNFLAEGTFDLVYFNDHFGSGYYSLLAKRSGLAPFCNQLHCVITHGSMEWVFNLNDYYACRLTDIEWMGLERRSVEMADVVIAPSVYLLEEYERYGWQLPAQTYHQPYPIFQSRAKVDHSRCLPVSELVLFGRLEVRKGLWLFCEALDRLVERFPTTKVTFLGRAIEFSDISSALQIVNRSARWPFRVRLFSDFDQKQALSYLCNPGKLAVMPALADNSPCAVYECMEAGIPFVSTHGSGADELVDPGCWDDVLVQPNVKSLTEKLAQILEHGARRGRPRFDPVQNLQTWSAWHRFVAEKREDLLRAPILHAARRGRSPLNHSKVALVVVIDRGACGLSLLIKNFTSHFKRFGGRAAYLLLSNRRGAVHDILREVFTNKSNGSTFPLFIAEPESLEEARHVISASEFVFFTDAETEITTSFFISALERLQPPSIISCVVAARENPEQPGEIAQLPTGDIPGLAAMQEPIGGSIWAVSAANLASDVSSLEFYDAQLDAFATSSSLGQILMQRCRTKGVPIHFLPLVGGVETQNPGTEGRKETNANPKAATALGIAASAYKGGAPWFAISAFGTCIEEVESSETLPEHAYDLLLARSDDDGKPDLSELAAVLGRAEMSLQLEAANGPKIGRLRHLADLATRAIRSCPVWDLLSVLTAGEVFGFGLGSVPEAYADGRNTIGLGKQAQAPVLDRRAIVSSGETTLRRRDQVYSHQEIGHAYVEAYRVRVRRNRIEALTDLRQGDPGKIFIVDVPLCGHRMLIARLRLTDTSDPLRVWLKIIDQKQGGEMGATSAHLVPNELAELSIALHGVYGLAAITLEFDGEEKTEVTIKSLQVQ